MKAEVKNITSPDFFDIKIFNPTEKENFSFLLECIVGVKGKDGGDVFSIEVCTPLWLLENNSHNIDCMVFGRGKLIVFEFDIDKITKKIINYCESLDAETWIELATKISRIGLWEFEDYRPFESIK